MPNPMKSRRVLTAALLGTCLVSVAAARQAADLIVSGDYVVTMDANQPVVKDGAVAVKDGRIVAVGARTQVAAA
ncbi:MAG: hypothetical protein HC872_06605 [Gammaproteobacteria bacterium]|nr:hypothetical protein [Gammaproteobacteria bacterium]